MKPIAPFIAIFAMLALSPAADAGDRAKADVVCEATAEKLVYDCMIMLTNKNSGAPIADAKIVIKAAMPSMPMAHNQAPVNAMAMGKRGNYHARMTFEMHGEWALSLDISGPLRDRLIKKLNLGKMRHGQGMKPGHGMPGKK